MKVAFFKGKHPGWKGILGTLTKWWTQGPYSHCELLLSGPDADGAYMCGSSTWLDKGVRVARLVLSPADWDIIDVPMSDAQVEIAAQWFETNKGAPYDVLALLGFLWRPIKGCGNMYFCDEAVLSAMGWAEAWRQDPNSAYQLLLGCIHLSAAPTQSIPVGESVTA